MASVKNLKKDINYVLSDIIEECYICQLTKDDKVSKKADEIIDEAISTFDDLIAKLNKKNVENKKKHFQSLNKDLEVKATALIEKIQKLKA
jgi:hypothetical protein